MNLDIISGDSYGRFNIKFASVAGLQTAVYMSELLDILKQVNRKKTFDENGYWTLNREYVESRTTISPDDQKKCDAKLANYNILHEDPENPDRIAIITSAFLALILEEDEGILADARKKLGKSKITTSAREGKRIGIIHRLQNGVAESDPELLAAYRSWIEVVYDKGVVKSQQVDSFMNAINTYTSDKSWKLKIIEIATTMAYREPAWSIQIFEKNYKSKMKAEQKISTGELGESF